MKKVTKSDVTALQKKMWSHKAEFIRWQIQKGVPPMMAVRNYDSAFGGAATFDSGKDTYYGLNSPSEGMGLYKQFLYTLPPEQPAIQPYNFTKDDLFKSNTDAARIDALEKELAKLKKGCGDD